METDRTVYDYMAPKYKDYTLTCPKCGRKAITTSFKPPIQHEVYIHVQEYNATTDVWSLTDYCSLEKKE